MKEKNGELPWVFLYADDKYNLVDYKKETTVPLPPIEDKILQGSSSSSHGWIIFPECFHGDRLVLLNPLLSLRFELPQFGREFEFLGAKLNKDLQLGPFEIFAKSKTKIAYMNCKNEDSKWTFSETYAVDFLNWDFAFFKGGILGANPKGGIYSLHPEVESSENFKMKRILGDANEESGRSYLVHTGDENGLLMLVRDSKQYAVYSVMENRGKLHCRHIKKVDGSFFIGDNDPVYVKSEFGCRGNSVYTVRIQWKQMDGLGAGFDCKVEEQDLAEVIVMPQGEETLHHSISGTWILPSLRLNNE